jgi:acyl carrier protein
MHPEIIREIVAQHARLRTDVSSLDDDADLYEAGLTSLSTVNLMLALEERFDVEFRDSMLKRRTFQSIRSLSEAIAELKGETSASLSGEGHRTSPSPLGEGRGEGQISAQQLRGVA